MVAIGREVVGIFVVEVESKPGTLNIPAAVIDNPVPTFIAPRALVVAIGREVVGIFVAPPSKAGTLNIPASVIDNPSPTCIAPRALVVAIGMVDAIVTADVVLFKVMLAPAISKPLDKSRISLSLRNVFTTVSAAVAIPITCPWPSTVKS